jgi:hypothetical protein
VPQIALPAGVDVLVNGGINAQRISLEEECISNAVIETPTSPADAIDTPKVRHRTIVTLPFNANEGATAAAVIVPAHVVYGAAGTIVAFAAGSIAIAVGAATVVVDLLKNGASILSGTITLDSGNTVRVLEAAPGFSSTTLVAGDILEAKIVSATAGGGAIPVGAFFRLVVDEDPA